MIAEKAPLRPVGSPTDLCLACGTCSAGCPLTGVSGFDPRKIVRMVLLGRDRELIESKLPWLCTLCGKCEHACPMGINIASLIRTARGLREREQVLGQIHKGAELGLKTGNNLGLPTEDFRFIIEDRRLGNGAGAGVRRLRGASSTSKAPSLLHTLHNKLVSTQNEDLVHWWKIFHVAREDFTIPSENWEGVNWGFFSGDDEAMKVFVGRIVAHMEKLNIHNLMYPSEGHAYLATRYGLAKWFPEFFDRYGALTVFDLLVDYLKSGRISLDESKIRQRVAYHDPRNYGRKSEELFGHGYYEEPCVGAGPVRERLGRSVSVQRNRCRRFRL
ncbi:MAG: 4Fe-4S dicluster domain-containing protein [Desulfosudis oleivorans]|nr:4Fe-4S dicluster domain-containing protein [Desulfosudis oleivorans]